MHETSIRTKPLSTSRLDNGQEVRACHQSQGEVYPMQPSKPRRDEDIAARFAKTSFLERGNWSHLRIGLLQKDRQELRKGNWLENDEKTINESHQFLKSRLSLGPRIELGEEVIT